MTATDPTPLVAVISDGSELGEQEAELEATLHSYVHWLRDLAGVSAVAAVLNGDDLDDPARAVRTACGADVTACFLVHTRFDRAWSLGQPLQEANPPVVTEGDLRAVAVAAQTLTELRRRERTAGQSSVVLVDGDQLPELGPLLTAVGVRDLIFWRRADAPAFPLARITSNADLVVALRTEHQDDLDAPGQETPPILHAPALTDSLTALPGLLTAAATTQRLQVDIDVLAAVAQLLATTSASTPGTAPDPALTDSISWVASQAMHHPRGS